MTYKIAPNRLSYLGSEGLSLIEWDLGTASYRYLSGLLVEHGLSPLLEVYDIENAESEVRLAMREWFEALSLDLRLEFIHFVFYGLGIFEDSAFEGDLDEPVTCDGTTLTLSAWFIELRVLIASIEYSRRPSLMTKFINLWSRVSFFAWT